MSIEKVTFDSVDDPANPKNWSYTRKVLITMLFGTTTMCSTFASSVFSSASPYISEEFHVGRQVTVLGISLFIAGYIFGPLLWSSLSEQYGRKWTILVPVFLFMCMTAMTATAKDLQVSFEVGRFRSGLNPSDFVIVPSIQTIYITRFIGGIGVQSRKRGFIGSYPN
jgi:DHA1 family multidrug resistance protein-like MFS transporter